MPESRLCRFCKMDVMSSLAGGPAGPYSPLFSLYLAGFQHLFGISGRTISYAVAFLAMLNVWTWGAYTLFLRKDIHSRSEPPTTVLSIFLALLLLSLLIVTEMILPIHNMLLLLLIPFSIMLSYRLLLVSHVWRLMLYLAATMGLLVLMCLAHYSAYVYIFPAFGILLFNKHWPRRITALLTIGALIIGILICRLSTDPWILSRSGKGLINVFAGFGAGFYTPAEYANHVVVNIGHFWFPQDYAWLGGLFILVFLIYGLMKKHGAIARDLVFNHPRMVYAATYAMISFAGIFSFIM